MPASSLRQLTPEELNAIQEGLTALETGDLYVDNVHPSDAHDALEKIWDPDYKPAPYSLSTPEWYISISTPFARAIQDIDHKIQRHIFVALSHISTKPLVEQSKQVLPLGGEAAGCWSYAIENHRVIYRVDQEACNIAFVCFTSSKEQQA